MFCLWVSRVVWLVFNTLIRLGVKLIRGDTHPARRLCLCGFSLNSDVDFIRSELNRSAREGRVRLDEQPPCPNTLTRLLLEINSFTVHNDQTSISPSRTRSLFNLEGSRKTRSSRILAHSPECT